MSPAIERHGQSTRDRAQGGGRRTTSLAAPRRSGVAWFSERHRRIFQPMRVWPIFPTILFTLASCQPRKVDPQVATGRELYGRMCAVCHGDAGEGYRADQATRLAQPDWLASASDGVLRDAVVNGREGTTMSAWGRSRGGPLGPEQVNALISYMRTWQQGATVTLDEAPLRGDAARGTILYRARCAECHGERGIGGRSPRIGNADFLRGVSDGYLRYAIARGRLGTRMSAFAPTLPPGDVDGIVAALRGFPSAVAAAVLPPPKVPPLPLGPVPLHAKGPE